MSKQHVNCPSITLRTPKRQKAIIFKLLWQEHSPWKLNLNLSFKILHFPIRPFYIVLKFALPTIYFAGFKGSCRNLIVLPLQSSS